MSEKKGLTDALHVKQTIHESTLHFTHGMSMTIDRFIVDLSQVGLKTGPFLVIFFWEHKMGAWILRNGKEYSEMEFKQVGQVQIPGEMVDMALQLVNFHSAVDGMGLERQFKELAGIKD